MPLGHPSQGPLSLSGEPVHIREAPDQSYQWPQESSHPSLFYLMLGFPEATSSDDNTDLFHGWRTQFLKGSSSHWAKICCLVCLGTNSMLLQFRYLKCPLCSEHLSFQVKQPYFSSPFLTWHDLESVYHHPGCFSTHQQKHVSSNLRILFKQNNSIIWPSQWLGKLLTYPKNGMGVPTKNADPPRFNQTSQFSKMNLSNVTKVWQPLV